MSCVPRIGNTLAPRHVALGLAAAFALAAGGCSADVTRFDFPAFNLAESGGPTGSLPAAPEPAGRRGPSYYETGPIPPPRGAGVNDDAGRGYGQQPHQPYQPSYSQPAQSQPAGRVAGTRGQQPAAPTSVELAPASERYAARGPEQGPGAERRGDYRAEPRVASSGEIEVQHGDTLFAIAKRHQVPVSALIDANGLENGSSIKPGQRLLLPVGARPARAAAEPAHRTAAETRTAPAAQEETSGWGGRYTMNPGDSLYSIARNHRVSLADLQRVNGITDPTKIPAGTVLQVPGAAAAEHERGVAPVARPQAQTQLQPPLHTGAPRVVQGPTGLPDQPRMLNGSGDQTRIASRGDTATDATDTGATKFRWPVSGRLIAAFGKRPDGSHNDGINLAVPQGTEVRAADSGRVAYAGDELKGYGNLVLIRHENGWVTAYAHSDELLVKRDDVVRRGQVIARAGRTGTVDQPQLHFELRQGAKPVDPLPFMERN